ncbi:MAG: hypothetical protein ACKOAJ_00820, partial [Actinomycetota bacterium]
QQAKLLEAQIRALNFSALPISDYSKKYWSDNVRKLQFVMQCNTFILSKAIFKSGKNIADVVVVDNGVIVDLSEGRAKVVGAVPVGYVYVDGQSIGDITEASIKDRLILGEEGFISVIVVIDSQSGKIVAGPDIHARGFAEDLELFNEVKGRIERALTGAVAGGINGTHQLSQVVRKTVGSWVGEEHRRRPMIVPVVIEV